MAGGILKRLARSKLKQRGFFAGSVGRPLSPRPLNRGVLESTSWGLEALKLYYIQSTL